MKNPMALLFLLFAMLVTAQQQTFALEVEISGFKSNEGQAVIGLFDNENHFLKVVKAHAKMPIKNKRVRYVFENLPQGNYAVSVYHDVNKNSNLDTNFMGIPKEAYACSNAAKGFMGPPKWRDAQLHLNQNKQIKIQI